MAEAKLVERCCEKKSYKEGLYRPGYQTEYTDNYIWSSYKKYRDLDNNLTECKEWAEKMDKEMYPTAEYDGKTSLMEKRESCEDYMKRMELEDKKMNETLIEVESASRNKEYRSDINGSIYRDVKLRPGPEGGYEDPFKNIITNNYGRRLYYDITHPDIVHPSMPSNELADASNIYSFKSPIRHVPEIPWKKDLMWKGESQVSNWPSKVWKAWTNVACAPPYDGYDDQCQYSKYKTPLVDEISMMGSNKREEYNCKY